MTLPELQRLAEQIQGYEQEGRALSGAWYEFADADKSDVGKLRDLCTHSLQALRTLSSALDNQLKSTRQQQGGRQQLEHAYHLVQELMQSRSASRELLDVIVRKDEYYKEYLRALSIKEKAAASHAQELSALLLKMQLQ